MCRLDISSVPYILCTRNIITYVSMAFSELSGYLSNDLIGKSYEYVSESIIRCSKPLIDIENLFNDTSCFIFSKTYECIEVTIKLIEDRSTSTKIFSYSEVPNSRLNNKFKYVHQLYLENISSIAIFSSDLILLYANQKYLDLFLEPYNIRKNSIGLPFSKIFKGLSGSNFESNLLKMINGGPIIRTKEFKSEKYSTTLAYWDSTIVPISENGKVKYIIENTYDVTERVQYRNSIKNQVKTIKLQRNQLEEYQSILLETNEQQLLLEKSKNEALEKTIQMKDEFLSLISHEFKTPLTVIYAAIQAMELICKDELSDKAKTFISKIRQNSFRQLRLVNNLLDITRTKAGHIKLNIKNLDIVFLTKSITESVIIYSHQKGIKITFVSTFGQKLIAIDEEKYERILLNLLSNAIKFTPHNKSITVILCYRKGFICIEVKDSGIGIPTDKLDLIFERFEQVDNSLSRNAEGTGIGLSLVKLFVTALGGSISVKSKVGKGSIFSVLLPDTKLPCCESEKINNNTLSENRLVHTTAIEFSDIYI